jgi:hypothetical protein
MRQNNFDVLRLGAALGVFMAHGSLFYDLQISSALLHKSAIGQDIPNPKWIYAAATVWGVPSAVN